MSETLPEAPAAIDVDAALTGAIRPGADQSLALPARAMLRQRFQQVEALRGLAGALREAVLDLPGGGDLTEAQVRELAVDAVADSGAYATSAQVAAVGRGVATGTLALAVGVHDAAPRTLYSTQNPAAEYDPVTNRTYLAYLAGYRRLYVTSFDHATGQWGDAAYVGPYFITNVDDDHGAPSLAIDQTARRVVVLYGVHNAQQAVARSGPGLDVSSWTVTRVGPAATYASVCYEPTTKALYAVFRAGGGHGATYPAHEFGSILRSTDGGATWTDLGAATGGLVHTKTAYPSDAATDYYGADADAVPGRVYLSWAIAHGTGHDGPRARAHVAYYDTATATMRTVDGTSLGAAVDTTAKMTACQVPGTDQDFVYPVKTALGPDGRLLVAYSRYDAATNLVAVHTALWDGTAWATRDTGVRSNYLYHGLAIAWRDGRWELGCVRNLGGDRTVAATAQADVLAGSSAGGDLVVLTSADALTWARDSVFARERFAGGGCMYLQAVRGAHPDLVMLAQPISLGTVRTGVGGPEPAGDQAQYNTATWAQPIYAVHSRAVLPRLVGLEHRPDVLMRVEPWYQASSAVPVPTSWTTVDLAALVPRGTTEVTLQVALTGTGTAGACVVSFREASTSRTSDAQVSTRGEWTDQMVYDVVVPLSPDRTYAWRGSAANATATIRPRALRIGTHARAIGAGATVVTPPPPDTTAPTVPATPTATAGTTSATASTTGSTDDTGVTGYRWYRAGALVGSTTGTTFAESGLPAGTPVAYTVAAVDAAGNASAQSAPSSEVTPTAAPAGGAGVTQVGADDFNRADAQLTSRQPSGMTWALDTGGAEHWLIRSGRLVRFGTATTTVGLLASPAPGVDQYAQVVLVQHSAVGSNNAKTVQLILRKTGTSWYAVSFDLVAGTVAISKVVSGTSTVLAAATPATVPAGALLYAQVAGGVITVRVNGAQVHTHTDASPLPTGQTGLRSSVNAAQNDAALNGGAYLLDDYAYGSLA